MSIGFYYGALEYKLSERRVEVMSEAMRLNIDLKNFYGDIIWQADNTKGSIGEKTKALNVILQPLFNETDPKYGIGYYDIRFDSVVAKTPDFEPAMLQSIPRNYQYFKSYESDKAEFIENYTSDGWNRKKVIYFTIPFSVNNILTGHVLANIKTDDVYESVFRYTIGVIGLFLVIFFSPFAVTWFMIGKIRKQLSSFAESILKNDGGYIDTRLLPELTPLLTSARAHTQQLRIYEAMVQNSNDSITTLDLNLIITSMNPAWLKMYGYTATEVLGKEMFILAIPNEVKELQEDFERFKAGEEIAKHHVQRMRKDGKVIDVSRSLSPIRDDQGQIIGIMCISRDITQDIQLEAQMKRLDGLNLIGQMAASIAHEIRNPMTTVRGFLQLLGDKPKLLEFKNYFQLMIEELDRANAIITEFLSFSRNKPIDLRRHNLNSILNKLLPMLQADGSKNGNDVIVELEEIPEVELDEQEIRQVILNLARNGLESMSAGGVLRIKTYLEKDQVVMTFCDQGSGILPEVLENIGKPFLTTKEDGTGLGLPVSYNIVYRHGGTVSIETGSEGTTFFIKLPVNRTPTILDN